MFAFQPRKLEVIIRVFLTAVMVVNAFVPMAALAAPEQNPGVESGKDLPRSLPEQKPAYYDAPEITYPERTSPERDKLKPAVPPKDLVEFTLTAEPAVVPVNGVVTFLVHIRNHSQGGLTSLVFTDSLESGLEYKADRTSPVTYDSGKKQVTLSID